MKELDIQIKNRRQAGEIIVKIDGKTVKPKPDASGDMTYKHMTENDTVKLEIVRAMDVGGSLWFLIRLFFFIITVFGLFDIHHKERFLIAELSAEIELKDVNKVVLQFNAPKDGGRAAEWKTELCVHETTNVYYTDERAKKKYKILNIIKLLTAIATVAIVATVVIKMLI